jgi:holo-[acyl-carrier protein] synthase
MSEIIGIGTDCVEIPRFRSITDSFIRKVFTKREIEYCRGKKNQAQHFAGRFAAKEAIIKAVPGLGAKVPLNRIEILNDNEGMPKAYVQSNEFPNCGILLSISHSDKLAIAFCVAIA